MSAFTVRGEGAFPFDMLRYDSCWPATENDAATMERAMRPRTRSTAYEVALSTASPNAPSVPRWESFGWEVVTHKARLRRGAPK